MEGGEGGGKDLNASRDRKEEGGKTKFFRVEKLFDAFFSDPFYWLFSFLKIHFCLHSKSVASRTILRFIEKIPRAWRQIFCPPF